MKNLTLGFLFAALFGIFQNATAQTTPRFSTALNNSCLKTTAEAFGTLTKDSCAAVTWYSNTPGTTSYTNIGSGNRLVYTWTKPGTYNLCAKLTNLCTKFDTVICKTVTVVACDCKLEADFTAIGDCKKVKFSSKINTAGATVKWFFGDKTDGSGTTTTKTYIKEGVYKVCMVVTVKDSTGKVCSTEVCKEIKVSCGKPCELKGDFKFGSGRNGEIRFNASSNSGYYYSWDFGDGTKGKGKDPLHRYTKAGVYTVCVTIVDKLEKCKITICKKVEVGNPCKLVGNFSFKQLNDSTFKFLASSSSAATYFWNWGDGTTSTGKDPQKIYKKPGIYTVCVKIYSTTSKCFIYVCKKIEVKAPVTKKPCDWSKAGFSITNKCNNYTFEANNISSSACIKYQFKIVNNAGTATYLTPSRIATFEFKNKGYYNVCAKFYDSCNKCDTWVCKTVLVDCLPCVAQASFTVDSVSTTGKMYVTNKSTGAKSYYWSFGDSTFSKDKTPSKSYSNSGTYYVCLVAYDSLNKCSTVYCTTVKVVKGRSQASVTPVNNDFTAYPNPSDNGFWIESNTMDIQYRIINVNGSVIQSGKINQPKLWITSNNWANGLYFLQIEEKSGMINQQSIIIQHP